MGQEIGRWEVLQEWISKSSSILVKKLSRNDCSWADDSTKHQNGFYVPASIRASGYFPTLYEKPLKPHIFEAEFLTLWPAAMREVKKSSLKHFSNKGTESHLTRVPKSEFSNLTPASLLVGGLLKFPEGANVWYWFIVVDAASEEAEIVETVFELGVDFECDIFDPEALTQTETGETELLIEQIRFAMSVGKLAEFVSAVSKLPRPELLASQAQNAYMEEFGLKSLNPYELECPGDAIMKISRDIEYMLYKKAELKHRAADVVRIISEGGGDLVRSVVRGFPSLSATFLSASQLRKTRAGRSFEQHISKLFCDGGILFEEQFITGNRRPDFVLPNGRMLDPVVRGSTDVLIFSAKTTLRERWKQLALERFNCDFFLATVDDRVSSEAIDDMRHQSIYLVVPESLKKSKDTCYEKKTNVMTFREFFDEEDLRKRPSFLNLIS